MFTTKTTYKLNSIIKEAYSLSYNEYASKTQYIVNRYDDII